MPYRDHVIRPLRRASGAEPSVGACVQTLMIEDRAAPLAFQVCHGFVLLEPPHSYLPILETHVYPNLPGRALNDVSGWRPVIRRPLGPDGAGTIGGSLGMPSFLPLYF